MQIANEKRVALEQTLSQGRNAAMTAAAACLIPLLRNEDVIASLVSSTGQETFQVVVLTSRSLMAGEFPDSELFSFRGRGHELDELSVTVTALASIREVEMFHAEIWSADGASLDIRARYRLHLTGRDPITVPVGRYTGAIDTEVEAFMAELLERWPARA